MGNDAREFLELLNREMAQVGEFIAGDAMGIGLVDAVREVDLAYLGIKHGDASVAALDRLALLRIALPHYVLETFERVPKFAVPAALAPRHAKATVLALGLLTRIGAIQQGRRLAYAALAGEVSMEKLNEGRFRFQVPDAFEGPEAHELELEEEYFAVSRKQIEARAKAALPPGMEARMEALFRENVYVYRGRYIGYNAHPVLDDYYFGLCYAELFTDRGFDSFHFSLQFGGVAYRDYTLAVAYFASVARKHERFCQALIAKHPDIRLGDIVTVTGERQEMIDSIAAVLNHYGPSFEGFRPIGQAQAEIIYRVLSGRRDNAALLGAGHMTIPLLLEVSPTHVVKSVAGPQLSASHFLLDALRFNFPKEYDRHQRTREASMQKALKRLLADAIHGVEFRENINLRRHGKKLTDLDFVVIEPRTRTAMLFQLKHQDAYGSDMKKRLNRTTHLVEDTCKWSEAVDGWLGHASRVEVASTLRLRKSTVIEHFQKVVIGRNFAHVLHRVAGEQGFAYATFIQFADALEALRRQGDFKSLAGLHTLLQGEMARGAGRRPPHRGGKFTLEDVAFEVAVGPG